MATCTPPPITSSPLTPRLRGEGLPYAQRHDYDSNLNSNSMASGYDKNTDYTAAITKNIILWYDYNIRNRSILLILREEYMYEKGKA
jgi:hypothetical protein